MTITIQECHDTMTEVLDYISEAQRVYKVLKQSFDYDIHIRSVGRLPDGEDLTIYKVTLTVYDREKEEK